jgi:hypothetical protein
MDRPDLDDRDVARLLGALQEAPVLPQGAFRQGLVEQLGRRLALRRGDGDLPADWSLCPFDRFCVAEQPIPHLLAANCPCLRGAPILRLLKSKGLPIHARPCAGQRLRQAAAVPQTGGGYGATHQQTPWGGVAAFVAGVTALGLALRRRLAR